MMRQVYTSKDRKSIPGLRTLRVHRGLSQQALAERTGLNQSRVSLIERGVSAQPGEIDSLAAALDVPVEGLINFRLSIDRPAALQPVNQG